jgi:hypothetical protein
MVKFNPLTKINAEIGKIDRKAKISEALPMYYIYVWRGHIGFPGLMENSVEESGIPGYA